MQWNIITTQGLIKKKKNIEKINVLLNIHILLWRKKLKNAAWASLHLMCLPSPALCHFPKSRCESEAPRERSCDVLDWKS